MKSRIALLTFLLALLTALPGFAQGGATGGALFKAGDKVNFIGNSITHSGGFHNHVLLYYVTRFPHANVMFYNSGISGDNANDIFRRLDNDIIPRQANWSVIMAGMNDVNRALYAPARQGEAGLEEQKQEAIRNYRNHLNKVLQKLSQTGTHIILQKPSIYDQTAQLPSENYIGVNDALQQCAQIVEELAQQYNTLVVDYWGFMSETNKRLQQKDPAATIVSIDRVHPWGTGDLVMAYQFLKETGAAQLVSEVVLEKGAVRKAANCTATVQASGKKTLTFQVKAASLPFPVEDEPQTALALSLVPLQDELNRETLQVNKLKAGSYTLSIDQTAIDTFTHEELAKGINLALYRNTPQYRQALEVKEQATAYRAVQRQLRDIKWVQNRDLPAHLWEAELTEVKKYMDSRLATLKSSNPKKHTEVAGYYGNYLKLKPEEQALEAKLVALNALMYKLSQPVVHQYQLTALPGTGNKNSLSRSGGSAIKF